MAPSGYNAIRVIFLIATFLFPGPLKPTEEEICTGGPAKPSHFAIFRTQEFTIRIEGREPIRKWYFQYFASRERLDPDIGLPSEHQTLGTMVSDFHFLIQAGASRRDSQFPNSGAAPIQPESHVCLLK